MPAPAKRPFNLCAMCPQPIGDDALMCRLHWSQVPKATADQVLATNGALHRWSPPAMRAAQFRAYDAARAAAIEAARSQTNTTAGGPKA